jgi:elongator complex protein 3
LNTIAREIIDELLTSQNPSRVTVSLVKLKVCSKYGADHIPSNAEIIENLASDERVKLVPLLRSKDVRSLSGVCVVAVMTKPYPCPKDEPCAYCPGGPSQGVPQSYTGREPACMRGIQNDYNPYLQVKSRIKQLNAIGHDIDKIELIMMGGTFPATPMKYQEFFIRRCLDAITGIESKSLDEAKKNAETSFLKNVGITVETRPDWARKNNIDLLLQMGVTRVEIGVQNIYDDIYKFINRGHTVQDVIEATRVLKDSGLKVCYHMMPGLPGSDFDRDLEAFETIFSNSKFKPDALKIYPCLVIKGTKLYDWWLRGEYHPYSTEEAAKLLVEVKKSVPPWIRIMRVQRDIPSYLIEDGVKKSNLREIVWDEMEKRGLKCQCIRCREVGHHSLMDCVEQDLDDIQLMKSVYEASEGTELFISFEDIKREILIGYLRLRIPSEKAHRSELVSSAIIRELHVYGPLVPVGKHVLKAWQHKGYGEALLAEAERISREEYDKRKIVVISALGTKAYYKRFGYDYDGVYMSHVL